MLPEETLRSRRNKTHCCPRGQSLSVFIFPWSFTIPPNSKKDCKVTIKLSNHKGSMICILKRHQVRQKQTNNQKKKQGKREKDHREPNETAKAFWQMLRKIVLSVEIIYACLNLGSSLCFLGNLCRMFGHFKRPKTRLKINRNSTSCYLWLSKRI